MEDTRKYYWIKIKTNYFSREDIDFLLSQKNGCEYVVLYQMLCLNVANNDGRLETKLGELIVPYNAEKISRDCKYFDIDTVNIALALYKKIGLIYEEENGTLRISNYDDMVGYESKWAEKKRLYRENKRIKVKEVELLEDKKEDNLEDIQEDKVGDIEEDIVLEDERTLSDKSIEIRDKRLEYRDKSINNIYSTTTTNAHACEKNLFEFLEERFGRTLSPSEFEIAKKWKDDELTRYAIKQAELARAFNVKYVNKILKSYEKEGIKTVTEAEERDRRYQDSKEVNHNYSKENAECLNKEILKQEATVEEIKELETEMEGL